METLFGYVLSASWQGGILIAVILLLRLLLRSAPRKYVCLLWLMAVIRLLIPLDISSGFSLQPDVPRQAVTVQVAQPQTTQDRNSPAQSPFIGEEPVFFFPEQASSVSQTNRVSEQPEAPAASADSPAPEVVSPSVDLMEAAAYLWAVVALGFGVYSIIAYFLLRFRLREAVRVGRGIWESSRVRTPFILGYLSPRIYLPTRLSSGNRHYILAHERTHLKTGDHWFKLLAFIALAIHWFNPLVWAAYILLCKDMEMACDERVVQSMSLEDRKHYSAALLACSAGRAHLTAFPVAFGEVSVKQRILRVLKYRKPSFWISLLAIIALIFVGVCFLTSPPEETPLPEETTSTEETVPSQVAASETQGAVSQEIPYDLSDFLPDESSEDPNGFGIQLAAYSKTATSATVYLSPSDRDQGANYLTDDSYWIEEKTESGWEALPELQAPDWSAATYSLGWDGFREQTVDWSERYGPLYGGPFRLCKTVTVAGQEYTYSSQFFVYENDPETEAEELALRQRIAEIVGEVTSRETFHVLQVVTDTAGETESTVEAMKNGDDFLAISEYSGTQFSGMSYNGIDYTLYGDYWIESSNNTHLEQPDDWAYTYTEGTVRVSLPDTLPAATDRSFSCQVDSSGYRQYITFSLDAAGKLTQIHLDRFFYSGYPTQNLTWATGDVDILDTDAQTIDAAIAAEAAQSSEMTFEEIDQMYREEQFHQDFSLGAGSFLWRMSDWYFRTGGENATSTGMRVTYSDAGAGSSGSLTTQGSYWLEQMVEGQWISVPALADPEADSKVLFSNPGGMTAVSLDFDWTDSYGSLEPGFYRLAQTVVLSSGGEELTKTVYTKFRVYAENAMDLLSQCRNAITDLLNQDSYHLFVTDWLTDIYDRDGDGEIDSDAHYYTTEVWKSGDNYLDEKYYIYYGDGSLMGHQGILLRNGSAYSLEWSADSVTSPLSGVTENGYADPSTFQIWTYTMDIYDSLLYDITQEANSIQVLETWGDTADNTFKESTYTFRDDGSLESIVVSIVGSDGSRRTDKEVTVYDTAKAEIDQLINSIDVDSPPAFSYAEEEASLAARTITTTGFVNTTASPVQTVQQAIDRAKKECTLPYWDETTYVEGSYNMVEAFYDPAADLWKVEFTYSQGGVYQAVYMGSDGITTMVVE